MSERSVVCVVCASRSLKHRRDASWQHCTLRSNSSHTTNTPPTLMKLQPLLQLDLVDPHTVLSDGVACGRLASQILPVEQQAHLLCLCRRGKKTKNKKENHKKKKGEEDVAVH